MTDWTKSFERRLEVRKAPIRGHHIRSDSTSIQISKLRLFLFSLGDAVFLTLVSSVTAMTMFYIHQLRWHFAISVFVGMILAMVIQVLMAFSVAPLLGSIESMIPSMVVAMISPMMVCAIHLGQYLSRSNCLNVSVALAITVFLMMHFYGFLFRRSLTRVGVERAR